MNCDSQSQLVKQEKKTTVLTKNKNLHYGPQLDVGLSVMQDHVQKNKISAYCAFLQVHAVVLSGKGFTKARITCVHSHAQC